MYYHVTEDWEPWEREHFDKFMSFIEQNGLSLPRGYRREEILRNIQAAGFNYKKSYEFITLSLEWRQT
jgi:hypothetical protein